MTIFPLEVSDSLTAQQFALNPELAGTTGPFTASLDLIRESGSIRVYRLRLEADAPQSPSPLKICWRYPAVNVKGVWSSGALYEKRLRADWEPADVESRVSVNAPAISVFGHRDENVLTFACSDGVNTARLAAPVREENNLLYCSISLFDETIEPVSAYTLDLYIDQGERTYCEALQGVGEWWDELAGAENLMQVPPAAIDPVYSTWYAYHQEMEPESLLAECRLAKELGYETIIVDDGWQTMDNQRGYDYTGDWTPDRFTDMKSFASNVQALGMKAMIWYSVPFCGPKSGAYQRFKGKFLTENHRWAPVFDPRYPEVREHLIGKYVGALRDWKLDGLKLDFIDDFRVYPETPEGKTDGRDYANVNEAVMRLISDISRELRAIRPDALIEFRQKYIGPALRKLGNLFRAFDCPNDSATNRLRTTDVRLLAGGSIVHSDMFMWHPDETVEAAALQINNVLFSVPQLSVRLAEQSADKTAMIRFWTGYYNDNRRFLLGGKFRAHAPLENYPMLSVREDRQMIVGLYGAAIVDLPEDVDYLDIINGRMNEDVVIKVRGKERLAELTIFDCMGKQKRQKHRLSPGIHLINVPASGLIELRLQTT
ncbi:MAG: glycoside hydrolase family 36 protein [Lewinella sp.]